MSHLLLSIIIGVGALAFLACIAHIFYKVWLRTDWFVAEVISFIPSSVVLYPVIFFMRLFPSGSDEPSATAKVCTFLFDALLFSALTYFVLWLWGTLAG